MAEFSVTNLATLLAAVNGTGGTRAVSGDVIRLAAGTYTLTEDLDPNHGVTIVGAGTGQTIIAGRWHCIISGWPQPVVIANLTTDMTGIAQNASSFGISEFRDGNFILIDCEFRDADQASAGNVLTFYANNFPVKAIIIRGKYHNADADVISTKAANSNGPDSFLHIVDAEIYDSGSGATDNVLTAHNLFSINVYGGHIHTGNGGPTVSYDTLETPLRLFGTKVTHDVASSPGLLCTSLKGCRVTTAQSITDLAQIFDYVEDCYLEGANVIPAADATSVRFENNHAKNASLQIDQASTNLSIINNYIESEATSGDGGIYVLGTTDGTVIIVGNQVYDCNFGVRFVDDGSPTVELKGNLIYGSASDALRVSGTGTITWDGCHNRISGSTTGYTPQTGDVMEDASVDAEMPQPYEIASWPTHPQRSFDWESMAAPLEQIAWSALSSAEAVETLIGTVDTVVDSILVDTNELQTDWANGGRLDLILDAVLAMLDDPRGEPGTGSPPVSADLATKVDYLYKRFRNKKDQDGTTWQLYADDGTTVDQQATISDSAGTTTFGEVASG